MIIQIFDDVIANQEYAPLHKNMKTLEKNL